MSSSNEGPELVWSETSWARAVSGSATDIYIDGLSSKLHLGIQTKGTPEEANTTKEEKPAGRAATPISLRSVTGAGQEDGSAAVDLSSLSDSDGDVDELELKGTVALEGISARKSRSIRETNFVIHYFTSVGSHPIHAPPQIPLDKGILPDDIYIHQDQLQRYQAWRCTGISPHEPRLSWTKLPEGTQESIGDGQMRTFVITSSGLPGWVVGPTIERKYKHGAASKTPTREGKNKGKQAVEVSGKAAAAESSSVKSKGKGKGE